MSRRYDEPVRVRTAPRPLHEDPAGESPERFVWRGRLHVVEEVLVSWRERRPWWVLADGLPRVSAGVGSPSLVELLAEGSDRWCWRVRARGGPTGPEGVYDLVREQVIDQVFEQNVGGHREGGTRQRDGSGTYTVWRVTAVGD